ncbi:MAG: DUF4433 domain-containing protein [Deltaproteobacteria bacterium]|nr:DUF4433 domain-containing protein [Deltaproteobacteria bacterium]
MKSWRDDIKNKIEELSKSLNPRGLHWWPKYLYHSTDVHNASGILKSGYLYSRAEAQKQGLMIVDNASPEIIDHTDLASLRNARLYFRPRTPTQYNNEGIRPLNNRSLNAHCPIPIFLCFDALKVLSLDETRFSDGNMASQKASCSDAREFYLRIPFEHVFHEGPFSEDARDSIIFHRHAEVLVPNSLQIDNFLRYIICRSTAERQTFLALLSNRIPRKWKDNIHLDNKSRFFYRLWTFVDSVVTTPDTLTFRFNPNTRTPGPFNAKVIFRENGRKPRFWTGKINAREPLTLTVSNAKKGVVTLKLDDALAYKGNVIFKREVI